MDNAMKQGVADSVRYLLSVLVVTVSVLAWNAALATEIYSWTDENGTVHFSSTKPSDTEAETINVDPGKGGVSYSQPDAGPAIDEGDVAEPAMTSAEQRRHDIASSREAQQQRDASIAEECGKHEKRLVEMEPARRVYYWDENGRQVRMNDDERVALIKESRDFVAENCN
jgi:hypothetical protein